ncbi:MAG: ADP-forming succinate--CoA ligase subunit beta [Bacteroidales bacterium]|nr:ADP-forming succinate--CoA ligase subunit beta [Bacteroidales bacterium]MDD4641770.1 ADP-forming succinate--CoA ligase subunit beta [Bacteroidales bacterium]
MKIHEHQAKSLFSDYGIPVPREILCSDTGTVPRAVEQLGLPLVVKAQVLTGGRGKAGGVKLARSAEEASAATSQILGMDIKGYRVNKVLLAEAVNIQAEYYIALTIDRNSKSVLLMASAEGGVEIEEVAKTRPQAIHKLSIDPLLGLTAFLARRIAFALFKDIALVKQAASIFQKMYKLLIDTDASLVEINPLVLTAEGQLLALDAKMNFDDNALYRRPQIAALREADQSELRELDAKEKGLSYIALDGNIGCMVNGAGLAMATMDLIKHYGGSPANFLDIGGSSNPQKVVDAMEIILSEKKVKSLMINIFGGITRCDDVARGLLEALEELQVDIPIVVNLSGTNAKEGLELLGGSSLHVVHSMREAAQKAIQLSQLSQD